MVNLRNIIGVIGLLLLCHPSFAGIIYNIDPSQSYIEKYVPSWNPNPYYGGFSYTIITSSGDYVYYEDVVPSVWQVEWTLTKFSISGNFEGSTELSPWVPDVGHFQIAQLNVSLVDDSISPTPTFNLPSMLTFYATSGEIVNLNWGCGYDLFYPSDGGYTLCFTSGIPPQLSGIIGSESLHIQGDSGGQTPIFIDTYTGTTPPDLNTLDPALKTPTYYSYQIVATAVPEPGILSLIFLGLAALFQVRRKNVQAKC